jgi:FkbM family methyltransferase
MSEHFVQVSKPVALAWKILNRLKRKPDFFHKHITGLIHIGANEGQERAKYAEHDLSVVWIEPIPEVFQTLQANLGPFPKQKALQLLVSETDDKDYVFNVASNNGASSSILELGEHSELYPSINYTRQLNLKGITLKTLIEREGWNDGTYQALVLDTQGSELSILKAAGESLKMFRFIETEVADFASYKGCCTLVEMEQYMTRLGYKRVACMRFASKPGLGSYYNVTYSL